jgi:hypothetical protein
MEMTISAVGGEPSVARHKIIPSLCNSEHPEKISVKSFASTALKTLESWRIEHVAAIKSGTKQRRERKVLGIVLKGGGRNPLFPFEIIRSLPS